MNIVQSIDDVTDDAIVEAIAQFGLVGVDFVYGSAGVIKCLLLLPVATNWDAHGIALYKRADRMAHLGWRLARIPGTNRITLSSIEWGKRLAGRSAGAIDAALKGNQ